MPRYKFDAKDFNPLTIISNIVILTSSYYIISIFFTILFNSLFNTRLHINQILSDEMLEFSTRYGTSYLCSYFFTCVIMIFIFIFVIDKSKKILDFALTTFFLHLVLSTINNGFPSKFLWWLINGIGISFITIISEYIVLMMERKEFMKKTSSNRTLN